jgi:hypothetical protein
MLINQPAMKASLLLLNMRREVNVVAVKVLA